MPNKVDCTIYKEQPPTIQCIVTCNISTLIYYLLYSRSVQHGMVYCIIHVYNIVMYLNIIIALHITPS